ncbi:MAG: hypothetical protein HC900_00880 [Methylacidiphilales bacterium]|nr:hypothetical protein [Candidatus Methylacidiphilales bacterium]
MNGEDIFIHNGVCHSGRRWFWGALLFPPDPAASDVFIHGRADTEAEALAALKAAVAEIAAGRHVRNDVPGPRRTASDLLRRANHERRRARPASAETASTPVEYLYNFSGRKFQIVKKTAQRIYFLRFQPMAGDEYMSEISFVDRKRIESDGSVFNSRLAETLYLEPPAHDEYVPRPLTAEDVARAKRVMMASHPDHGGDDEAFIEARERYEHLKSKLEVQQATSSTIGYAC